MGTVVDAVKRKVLDPVMQDQEDLLSFNIPSLSLSLKYQKHVTARKKNRKCENTYICVSIYFPIYIYMDTKWQAKKKN